MASNQQSPIDGCQSWMSMTTHAQLCILCRHAQHHHGLCQSITHIRNNAWVMQFANDFHSWLRHSRKSLANRLTRDPKIVIHGNECFILFLTRCFMSWTHNSAKNNHRSLTSQLSPGTVVSDLALWRHHSGSVTSRERKIQTLWRHFRRLFSHAQIGAKAIFTSE